MSDAVGRRQAADRVVVQPWLARLLGCRPDVTLRLCVTSSDASPLRLAADSGAGSLLLVEVLDPRLPAPKRLLLKVLPLQLGAGVDGTSASIGRWRTEWEDHLAASPEGAGAVPFAQGVVSPAEVAPIVPPVFVCKEKRVVIPVVCRDCATARADPKQLGDADRCTVCGTPKTGDQRPPSSSGVARTLERLWDRVVRTDSGEAASAENGISATPFCLSCERRTRCFPASGLSAAPGTASEMLQPLSARPWGGVILDPVELPLAAYVKLIEGRPWQELVDACPGMPDELLHEVEGRLRSDRLFLHPSGSGGAHGQESLLLRLEVLRQLLTALGELSSSRNHPNLGVDPETIWVRLLPTDNLRTSLWSAEVRLLATAPGCLEGAEGAERPGKHVPAPTRPPALSPPGCQQRMDWVDGVLLPTAKSPQGATREKTKVDFLPQSDFKKPPAAGETVVLALPAGSGGVSEDDLQGVVDHAFEDMCRIEIEQGAQGQIVGMLQRSLGGFPVRLRPVRDHALVDDLFAAGTLWLSLLLKDSGDLALASRIRDVVAARLKSGLPGGFGEAADKELLRIAASTGLLAFRAEETPVQSGGDSGAHPVEGRLLAQCIALGMRLCGAFPDSYTGQNHEPTTADERGKVYESMLAQLAEISRRLRDRLFRSGGGGEEILSVLAEYATVRRKRGGRS